MSGMKHLNQRGHLNGLLIPLILVLLLLMGAIGFGVWAYAGRQDYKDNSDQKVVAAVATAEQNTAAKKDKDFLEQEKQPFRQYNGPIALGSLVLTYPKTWSGYVNEKSNASTPLDGYFQPGVVPYVDGTASYALRVQIVSNSYANVLKSFDSNVKSSKLKATAYNPAKVPTVTGVRLDGEVSPKKQGSMVVVPIRDKTLEIWTESNDFVKDFNENILPNYTFLQ